MDGENCGCICEDYLLCFVLLSRNERPFVCNLCGHAFSQKNNLNMHLRIHSGERPYQCHLCGKTFRTQGNSYSILRKTCIMLYLLINATVFLIPASLDKHNRTHTGERPFSCDVCEQRFTEKGALVRHKASKHEEGRPHCCHICGKTFKGNRPDLAVCHYQWTCHVLCSDERGVKEFLMWFFLCFLLSPAREQLRVHLRRHKGMRKFECIDCGYKFTRQVSSLIVMPQFNFKWSVYLSVTV